MEYQDPSQAPLELVLRLTSERYECLAGFRLRAQLATRAPNPQNSQVLALCKRYRHFIMAPGFEQKNSSGGEREERRWWRSLWCLLHCRHARF